MATDWRAVNLAHLGRIHGRAWARLADGHYRRGFLEGVAGAVAE